MLNYLILGAVVLMSFGVSLWVYNKYGIEQIEKLRSISIIVSFLFTSYFMYSIPGDEPFIYIQGFWILVFVTAYIFMTRYVYDKLMTEIEGKPLCGYLSYQIFGILVMCFLTAAIISRIISGV